MNIIYMSLCAYYLALLIFYPKNICLRVSSHLKVCCTLEKSEQYTSPEPWTGASREVINADSF